MKQPLLLAWVAAALTCSALMWLLPGSETVPYHIAWATFALCYGLEQWSRLVTAWALGSFTVVTGAILVDRISTGVLDWQESAEIPLMLLLMALMVWHVRRRNSALGSVMVVAERQRNESAARDLLTQRTSHEMRSPLTIARGYLELVRARAQHIDDASDLAIVDEELVRLTRVCDRLVRSMRVIADLEETAVDVDSVLAQIERRWSAVVDRDWRLVASGGTMYCSEERLRACLDTLIENAVRYTHAGDVVELYARAHDDEVTIGVADSGPGFVAGAIEAILAHGPSTGAGLVRDELSQSGLGLSMVCEVVARRGGRVELGRSSAGGAEVAMVVPREGRRSPYSAPAAPAVEAGSDPTPRFRPRSSPRDPSLANAGRLARMTAPRR